MDTVFASCRWMLCLMLSVLLSFPAGLWGEMKYADHDARRVWANMAGGESLRGEPYCLPREKMGLGMFTCILLGDAGDASGVVWSNDLFGHVNQEVRKLRKGYQQSHFELRGNDPPVFVVDQPEKEHPTLAMPVKEPGTPVTMSEKRGRLDRRFFTPTDGLVVLLGAAAAAGLVVWIKTRTRNPPEGLLPSAGVIVIEEARLPE